MRTVFVFYLFWLLNKFSTLKNIKLFLKLKKEKKTVQGIEAAMDLLSGPNIAVQSGIHTFWFHSPFSAYANCLFKIRHPSHPTKISTFLSRQPQMAESKPDQTTHFLSGSIFLFSSCSFNLLYDLVQYMLLVQNFKYGYDFY